MSDKPENPPAFPLPDIFSEGGMPMSQGHPGASLRDVFAWQALPGLLTICVNDSLSGEITYAEYIARLAYETADAMLAERAKGPTP